MSDPWHVVVTGSSGGIGAAVCEALIGQGHEVTGIDAVSRPGASWDQLQVDLSVPGAAVEAGQRSRARRPVTHLVHCAALQVMGGAGEVADDAWSATLRVNVLAVDGLVRACADDLRDARGAIVVVSSVHAAATTPGMVAYATSKAALQGWVRAAALDLAPDVRVNVVQPGAVRTAMLTEGLARRPGEGSAEDSLQLLASKSPLRLIADPQDVVGAVTFLLDGRTSRFTTGSTLTVDGGALLRLSTE